MQAEGGAAHGIAADISKDADNKRIVDKTISKYGRLDVSFINAGTGERLDILDVQISSYIHYNIQKYTFAFVLSCLPAIQS
jgi:NAD(P)-dependent dehydrogenase (short-subunit alcohol dehydrogenase family)